MTTHPTPRATRCHCLECAYAYTGPHTELSAQAHAALTRHTVYLDTGIPIYPHDRL